MHLRALLPFTLIGWLGLEATLAVAADSPSIARVSIVKHRTTQPLLKIDYPWTKHENASVEIRLATGETVNEAGILPIFFATKYLEGDVRVTVYQAQDAAAGTGTVTPITKDGLDYDIVGQRNSLGKQAVSIGCEFPSGDPAPGTAVSFCRLPSWALSKRTLLIDLPASYLAKPGPLTVWFLRGDTVVWTQKLDWPGYAAAAREK